MQRNNIFKYENKRVVNLVDKYFRRKIGEYITKLIKFYETNDYTEISKWIYDNCIDGI